MSALLYFTIKNAKIMVVMLNDESMYFKVGESMKKRFGAAALAVFMMMSSMSVFAEETISVPEETLAVSESQTESVDNETQGILETVESDESIPASEIQSETEVMVETETEETEKSFTEKLLEENEDTGGIIEEQYDEFYETYEGALDVTDKNSDIVPLILSYTFYYSEAHRVLELVNQIRAENGVAPLVWDAELEEAACLRAAECGLYFDHTRPNGQSCYSVTSKMSGENIAAGVGSAEQVVALWMGSEGHRANILNPDFKSMGVGLNYIDDGQFGYYWSQNFGYGDGDGRYIASGQGDLSLVIETIGTEAACQVKNFVIRLYELVLGRKADYDGLTDWFNRLIYEINTGAEVAQGFVFSNEFQNKKLSNEKFIEILYNTMFDRSGDAVGKQVWMDELATGFSRLYVYRGFAESREFTTLCGAFGIQRGSVDLVESRDLNPGVTRFVSRLYSKALNRTPDIKGLNEWTGWILGNETTPEKVAYGFFFSDEMKAKQLSDEEFVKVMYRVFLDREADAGGLSNWTGYLKRGMKREVAMYGISKSQEFANILTSYGLQATQGEMVYVTTTGEKYHTGDCRFTSNTSIPLLLEDAQSIGFTPCQICH